MSRHLLFAVFVSLSACAGADRASDSAAGDSPATVAVAQKSAAVKDDPVGRWKLVGRDGGSASIEFRDGKVSADAGCNKLGADYTRNADGTLTIGPVMRSKMFCPDRMALEDALTEALPNTTKVRRDPAQLELLDARGDVLLKLDAE